jgi:hypothetical protein
MTTEEIEETEQEPTAGEEIGPAARNELLSCQIIHWKWSIWQEFFFLLL